MGDRTTDTTTTAPQGQTTGLTWTPTAIRHLGDKAPTYNPDDTTHLSVMPVHPVQMTVTLEVTAHCLPETIDPERIARDVAEAAALKAGYGPDTEEPTDLLLVDVNRVGYGPAVPVAGKYTQERLTEEADGRDWMSLDDDAPDFEPIAHLFES